MFIVNGHASWSNTQYASISEDITISGEVLQSSTVRIYLSPENVQERQNCTYYAVSTSRIAVTDCDGSPIIYNYNNL